MKIVLNIEMGDGREIALSIKEAKEIFEALQEYFGKEDKQIHQTMGYNLNQ